MRIPALFTGLVSIGLILSATNMVANAAASNTLPKSDILGLISMATNSQAEVSEIADPQPEPEKEPEKPKKKPIVVTVKKGDTLTKIAKAHKTTYKRIFDANKKIANPNIINPGELIRVPFEDEVLPSRQMPKATNPVSKKSNARTALSSRKISTNAKAVASGSVWDRLAACESGGNWLINTGNGYYGGLQFTLSTWRAVGGQGYPHQNSRAEQIRRAEILLARSGWGQWPACTAMLGLR